MGKNDLKRLENELKFLEAAFELGVSSSNEYYGRAGVFEKFASETNDLTY